MVVGTRPSPRPRCNLPIYPPPRPGLGGASRETPAFQLLRTREGSTGSSRAQPFTLSGLVTVLGNSHGQQLPQSKSLVFSAIQQSIGGSPQQRRPSTDTGRQLALGVTVGRSSNPGIPPHLPTAATPLQPPFATASTCPTASRTLKRQGIVRGASFQLRQPRRTFTVFPLTTVACYAPSMRWRVCRLESVIRITH